MIYEIGSSLDYFGARYYASTTGRFLSPDEFTGGPVDAFSASDPLPPGPLPYADITNPQSLNKYAYTLNNPLTYVDPNGHQEIDYKKLAAYMNAGAAVGTVVGALLGGAGGGAAGAGGGTLVAPGFGTVGGGIAGASAGATAGAAKGYGVGAAIGASLYFLFNSTNQGGGNRDDGGSDSTSDSGSSRQQQLKYEPSPKHHQNVQGKVSPAPKDGQGTLNNSFQVKDTSPMRVGVDKANNQIVVFRETQKNTFHGYTAKWNQLSNEVRAALIKRGLVDKKGNIIQ